MEYPDIVVPKFPKHVPQSAWDKFYRMAQDEQFVDKHRSATYLEQVKAKSKDQEHFRKSIDGIGECYAEMDSRMYHRQMQNDPDFWKDASNVKKFFKDNDQYLNQGHKV